MPYRLLALDIDGTLVNGRDELTEPTRAALATAAEAGVRVVLVTGRQYSRALPLARQLDLAAPIVTASGALIKNPADHGTLWRAAFAGGVLDAALKAVVQCGYDPVLYTDTYAEGYDYHYDVDDRPPSVELAEFVELNAARGRACPGLIGCPPRDVYAGFAIGPHGEMLALEAELHRRLPGGLSLHVLRSPRYAGFFCEIAPAGVTKWSALRHLAAAWGIADEAICAVGDDVNDIAMIQGAGLGVAMGNAAQSVKAVADRVAPAHDADGLVQVVRWILE